MLKCFCKLLMCIREIQMAIDRWYMKKCPLSLPVRKMQLKTTMKYLTPVRLAHTKRVDIISDGIGREGKRILIYCWQKCFTQPLWKTVWGFLKKLKTFHMTSSFTWHLPPKKQFQRHLQSFGHCSSIHNSQGLETVCLLKNI